MLNMTGFRSPYMAKKILKSNYKDAVESIKQRKLAGSISNRKGSSETKKDTLHSSRDLNKKSCLNLNLSGIMCMNPKKGKSHIQKMQKKQKTGQLKEDNCNFFSDESGNQEYGGGTADEDSVDKKQIFSTNEL